MALGYDLVTARVGRHHVPLQCRPRLGSLIGPAGNFSTLQDPELYLLSLMMLLGRLEVLTVLVVLTPIF